MGGGGGCACRSRGNGALVPWEPKGSGDRTHTWEAMEGRWSSGPSPGWKPTAIVGEGRLAVEDGSGLDMTRSAGVGGGGAGAAAGGGAVAIDCDVARLAAVGDEADYVQEIRDASSAELGRGRRAIWRGAAGTRREGFRGRPVPSRGGSSSYKNGARGGRKERRVKSLERLNEVQGCGLRCSCRGWPPIRAAMDSLPTGCGILSCLSACRVVVAGCTSVLPACCDVLSAELVEAITEHWWGAL